MKKVTFLYRDASNYKCRVEKEFADSEIKALNLYEGKEDVAFEEVGVTDKDIELIVKYGRDDDDHNLLDVESIEEAEVDHA